MSLCLPVEAFPPYKDRMIRRFNLVKLEKVCTSTIYAATAAKTNPCFPLPEAQLRQRGPLPVQLEPHLVLIVASDFESLT